MIELTNKNFKNNGKDNVYIKNNDNKLGMLLIYANWCGHCTRFKPDYLKLSEYMKDSFPCYAIEDTELKKDPELAKSINFQGYPTIKNIGIDGKIVDNYNGSRDLNDILTYICINHKYCPSRQ